jgi:putative transposase
MPRKARIDAPGALHHIIVRGIERRNIFLDDTDRDNFIDRLSAVLDETQTACFAWALIPNHFHLLLRTGSAAISRVMQRILTGYAISFNKRHQRHGHLFQNRYKSILCQEDVYLLELVRYIHLNPLRANIVTTYKELQEYPYCGHSAFFRKGYRPWQDTDYVLKRFHSSISVSRRRYLEFVEKGMDQGRRDELVGGGLVRSAGGWTGVKTLHDAGILQKNDERILGDSEFVEKALFLANEKMERCYRLQVKGVDFQKAIRRAGEMTGVDPDAILSRDRGRRTVQARSLACYWAAEELGFKQPEIGLKLGMTQAAVSLAIKRGKLLAAENKMSLIE